MQQRSGLLARGSLHQDRVRALVSTLPGSRAEVLTWPIEPAPTARR